MEIKDILTLTMSGLAFLLSIIATVVTLRQKKYETERTLRQQLTDAIGKLNGAFEQMAKLREEKSETWNELSVVNLKAFYNGQKLFYARQAIYVADQIPGLVSETEYNSIARAFVDADDDEHAVLYYERAIAVSKDSLYRATNLRGYARILIQMGRLVQGRSSFEEAIGLVSAVTDSACWFKAETFQRWAQIEAAVGEQLRARQLFDEAELKYKTIGFRPRRDEGLRNLTSARKAAFGESSQHAPEADADRGRDEGQPAT